MDYASVFLLRMPSADDANFGVLTPGSRETFRRTAAPEAGQQLADVLPLQAMDVIESLQRERKPIALFLDQGLPEAWQAAPWETLRFRGRPFATMGLVVRNAVPTLGESPVCPVGSARAAYLTLFPREDFDFRRAFEDDVLEGKLVCIADRQLPDSDADRFDDLFILAHGDASGLLEHDGRAFAWLTRALPSRVWLLACNVDRGMFAVASQLLSGRVRTVVTTTDRVDAVQMADVVRQWLRRREPTPLESWLMQARAQPAGAPGGVKALTLMGEATADRSSAAPFNAMTLAHWRRGSVDAPRLDEYDDALFHHAADVVAAMAAWPIADDWLFGEVLAAAENRHHPTMRKLQQRAASHRVTPHQLLGLAAAEYRLGEYDLAARHAVDGIWHADAEGETLARLWSQIVNIAIDKRLPAAAAHGLAKHRACRIDDPLARYRQQFRRLDQEARLAFLEGRWAQAMARIEAKLEISTESSSAREQSWLLYMASWRDRDSGQPGEDTPRYVMAVRERVLLEPTSDFAGNHDFPYLLRATACHGWARQDSASLQQVALYEPLLRERLKMIDPGPWAFALAYLSLARMAQGDPAGAAGFEAALDALDRANYFAEAAAFARLAGDEARGRTWHELARKACMPVIREFDRLPGMPPLEDAGEKGPLIPM